jgi:hypothetical protein
MDGKGRRVQDGGRKMKEEKDIWNSKKNIIEFVMGKNIIKK